MGRPNSSENANKIKIICNKGEIFVQGPRISVYYRYRWWFFRINPRILFPGLRRDHRKKIFVNGKNRGYAEFRGGRVPLPRYRRGQDLISNILDIFIHEKLGILCRQEECGYHLIHTMNTDYIVTERLTKEEHILCQVYIKETGEPIGSFVYNKDCNEIYPTLVAQRLVNTFTVIMGYVTETVLYSTMASKLNRTIELKQ